MSKQLNKKDINALHTELGHLLEEITQATGKTVCLQLTGMFEPCKAYALSKANKDGIIMIAVPHSTIKTR